MSLIQRTANNEQSSVKERLLKFIEFKHLNIKQFEEKAGLSTSYVSNMRKSIKASTFDEKIAPAFPDLNKYWLLHGEGEMLLSTDNTIDDVKINISASSIKNKPHDEQMEILYNKIDELENTVKILKDRDQLYFKAIIAHLGIDAAETQEMKEQEKSNTN